MNKTITKSLDERVAIALKADDISPAEVGQLITEVEAAAKAADERASKAHQDALDPSKIVDAKTVGAAVATAALTRDRLQAALPRLREKQKVQAEIEYSIAWSAERDKVEAMRNELVANLQRYPALAAEMIDMVQRIAPIDAMIRHVNATRPDGEHALLNTEEIARDVTGFVASGWPNGLLSLVTEMKLPKFKLDGDGYQYTYPPPQPTLAQQMIASGGLAVPYNPMSPHWHEAIAARDAERQAEFDKAAAFSANQEAERERRRQAEHQEMLRRRQQQRGL
jgi:hypothetical protein